MESLAGPGEKPEVKLPKRIEFVLHILKVIALMNMTITYILCDS